MFNIFSEKLDKFTSSPYGANNLKINEKILDLSNIDFVFFKL